MEEERGQETPRPRRRFWLVLVVALLLGLLIALAQLRAAFAPPPPSPIPVADVSSERLLALGSVLGFAAPHETHAWVGLPFAKPPVDGLRWRAPRPPTAWGERGGTRCREPPQHQRLFGTASRQPAEAGTGEGPLRRPSRPATSG